MNIGIVGPDTFQATALKDGRGRHELRFFAGSLDSAFVARDFARDLTANEARSVFGHDRVTADVIDGLPRGFAEE